jgi:hypothetical protein
MEVPERNHGRLTESYVTVQEHLLKTAVGTIPFPPLFGAFRVVTVCKIV